MKILIAVPHIFRPVSGSLYSSETEEKREIKAEALKNATIGNICRHTSDAWIHASLGKGRDIVTRRVNACEEINVKIQLYTIKGLNLINELPENENLEIIEVEGSDPKEIPQIASRRLLEQAQNYNILGYMEDDIAINDRSFFQKVRLFEEIFPDEFIIIPHRCESMANKGDVILSGDPDGGRKDLFWDTGEAIRMRWQLGDKTFYRATNPHSGCFFIGKRKAMVLKKKWEERGWKSPFQLSGPMEQAASGRLIEFYKIMKPVPEEYKFFMVKHMDCLYKRHRFEDQKDINS